MSLVARRTQGHGVPIMNDTSIILYADGIWSNKEKYTMQKLKRHCLPSTFAGIFEFHIRSLPSLSFPLPVIQAEARCVVLCFLSSDVRWVLGYNCS